ncbi:unnamed protein product [Mesocestoides corti]|uniref:Aminotransferase class V domain-containing protein n=1 Tax=Mesocestoides corti TaxID=53468 RepID=A0A158QV86_MESCO|nr:unnamed protein product [Mesocestoides corti]
MLVCLSAASNVTGILVDTNAASSLVHRYGGIIFWDYAAAAPYVEMDMNPSPKDGVDNAYKDALFFSVHKFVGGPQTPGILVAKKKLFEAGENYPFQSGGGTVSFVRRKHTSYVKDVENREEGGTPAIIGSIRAGMVIQLKEAIGTKLIRKREDELVQDNEEILEHKVLRPGFTRINLPFFYPDEEIDFVLDAIIFVAKYAWTFLPFYELDQSTGQWRYCNDKRSDMGKHLSNISYERGVMRWRKPAQKSAGPVPSTLKECMSMALTLQQSHETLLSQSNCSLTNEKIDRYWMRSKVNYLRWFLLSSEAAADARGQARPIAQYPNAGSPWHPGCIERCFCPDLAKRNNGSLARLCEYTGSKMAATVVEEKHLYSNGRRRSVYNVSTSSSSERSVESNSGTDIICVHRVAASEKENRVSSNHNNRPRGKSSQRERLEICDKYSSIQLSCDMTEERHLPSKFPFGEVTWCTPSPQLFKPTIQDLSISNW